jgi:hypothetical protein
MARMTVVVSRVPHIAARLVCIEPRWQMDHLTRKADNRAYLNTLLEIAGGTREVEDHDEIRTEAIKAFTKALDAKLKNLQDGEMLAMMFRFDIVDRDGDIRGGSGHQRNMPEYAEWRKAVYQRDNYTCQECGAQGKIVAHHIKQWAHHPELRFDVSNGLTLCDDCHAVKHPHIRFGKRGKAD